MGFAIYFQPFVPGYASLAAPLYDMSADKFDWNRKPWKVDYLAAFKAFKQALNAGKLFISKELLSGKRKDPYKEPEIKDYGTAHVNTQDQDVELRSSVSYTLDDNQKLRLRREHQRWIGFR